MNSIIYFVIALLLLTAVILFVISGLFKKEVVEEKTPPQSVKPMSKEEGEDHFSMLMNAITPVWYWRVNHEYIDFLHATIKRMNIADLNATEGLFEAQRRCSDLNSAVYKYYDNIKKRCLNGEKVPRGDLDVLNLQQCFREFSLNAYPALVVLVWPEFQRPVVDPLEV
ncbi:MAG: ESA_00282 family adhesion-associated protein [Scandinavium sp.]|uniref:ESA_00282 family adhesion-associated protein n=1 Tax=Scandinavium sp. TaxID=2830653 RepID=UPI003F2DE06B